MTRVVDSLGEIAGDYDVVFCDLWGCLHNGLEPYDAAVEALRNFRAGGGTVLLLTNAPRPRADVARQIDQIGVPRDCWDVIATSGDSARAAMFEGAVGRRVYHIGVAVETGFFEPMRLVEDAIEIERVPLGEAEGIVCTGPFDPLAHPSEMRGDLHDAVNRGLKLLCANPDIVVDRGLEREWCAGAIAALYTELGGESLYFGKPHGPIYDLARRRMVQAGAKEDARILAIGDGILTDVAGAEAAGLDVLFVTGGLAAEETGTTHQPDADLLQTWLEAQTHAPTYAIGFLR
ncbi:TIGR01459 family HAD-type hydrolase [Roseitranquillus sediminis]|uniref:TIGR01459 family HAD-type hydrolase n=1 Tax=Roseitranquillus sediminis TaxID=2809051 RepID=UPI001D0CD17C|nr:TIGR01459 family HAD-type hydrolase [Roseitranquillus sediminis]MBM9594952.1 TIGR01459 family HAD-type hydrolase [Roseitranquillus sediminis]